MACPRKYLVAFCCFMMFIPSLLWAKYPADLKNIPAGNWSVERIDIQSAVQRLADEITTSSASIKFLVEGWNESTTTSLRTENGERFFNYAIKRFPVDARGKTLAQVLDRMTQAQENFTWTYDNRFGVVNLMDKRLADLPQWPMNYPVPESLKKEQVSYEEIKTFFLKNLHYFQEDEDIESENWLYWADWKRGQTKCLKLAQGQLWTLRDLVNCLLSQKQEREEDEDATGTNYAAFFLVRPPDVAVKQLQKKGMVNGKWHISTRIPYSTETLVDVMHYFDKDIEAAKKIQKF
jgi:hypothetical protein